MVYMMFVYGFDDVCIWYRWYMYMVYLMSVYVIDDIHNMVFVMSFYGFDDVSRYR